MNVHYLPFGRLRVGDKFKPLEGGAAMKVAPLCHGHDLGTVDAVVIKDGHPFDRSQKVNFVQLVDNDMWPRGAMGMMQDATAVLVDAALFRERT